MANTYHRQHFSILVDTGVAGNTTKGDTGAPAWGELMQVHIGSKHFADSGDTGLSITLTQIPVFGGDTGRGWNILLVEDVRTHGTFGVLQRSRLGGDTGTSDSGMHTPYVFAGDRLRIKATAGTTLSDSGLPVDVWCYFRT